MFFLFIFVFWSCFSTLCLYVFFFNMLAINWIIVALCNIDFSSCFFQALLYFLAFNSLNMMYLSLNLFAFILLVNLVFVTFCQQIWRNYDYFCFPIFPILAVFPFVFPVINMPDLLISSDTLLIFSLFLSILFTLDYAC